MGKPRFLFLYSELMPYTYDILKNLVINNKAEIYLIHWDTKKRHPYFFDTKIFYKCLPISLLNITVISKELKEFNPQIVYCSGLMDIRYLKLIRILNFKNITVMGCDNQWEGSFKDYIKSYFSFLFYKPFFKYAWIPGYQQYEYCRRIGFRKENIIFNLYSSPEVFINCDFKSQKKIQKKILYVGRDAKVKNIEFLVSVFLGINEDHLNNWKLYLVGSSSFTKYAIKDKIIALPFTDSNELVNMSNDFDAFILPSVHEPWGVVVHEFSSKGLILLLSNKIGSKDHFLIEGFNGYSFDPYDKQSLVFCLNKLFNLDCNQINDMKANSRILASKIDSKISSYSFLSLLYKININTEN